LDIARQFLTGISPELFYKYAHLRTLQEIILSTQKAQRIQLKSVLKHSPRPIRLQPDTAYRLVTVRLYGKGVQLRSETQGADLKGTNWFRVQTGDLIMSKIDARNGAFGIIPQNLDGAIVTNEFPVFIVSSSDWVPEFLLAMLTRPHFYQQFDAMVSGASGRRRVEPEEFLEMEIPDVQPTTQRELGAKLVELCRIISSASAEQEALEKKVNDMMEN
jgi:type I restriction enzyme S subunit